MRKEKNGGFMDNQEILTNAKIFLSKKFEILKEFEREGKGGKIRSTSGETVEQLIDLIWSDLCKKYPEVDAKITVGRETSLKIEDEDGNFIEESVDRHCFINDKMVLAIEAKTYLDKPYMQRASDDFKLMKKVDPNFHAMVLSLEDSINEGSFNFLLNKKHIDSVYFLATGKRRSEKHRRIYNTPERIQDDLILDFIAKLEVFFSGDC